MNFLNIDTVGLAEICLAGSLATYILTRLVIRLAPLVGLIDKPNARSSHKIPTARGGGAAFVLAFGFLLLFGHLLLPNASIGRTFSPLLSACLIALIGFVDDFKSVSVRRRMFIHFLAVGLFMFNFVPFMDLELSYFLICILILVGSVWMVNLYNFMDGTDGLAAANGVFIFAMAAYFSSSREVSILAGLFASCLAGFLVLNWPKASIFMGDSGSGFIGFLIAAFFMIEFFTGNPWRSFYWIILTSTFWFDATVTLIRRIVAGEKFSEGHLHHTFQRLHHKLGWSHLHVLLSYMAVNFIFVYGTIYLFFEITGPTMGGVMICIGTITGILTCLYLLVERFAPMVCLAPVKGRPKNSPSHGISSESTSEMV